jgi:hypothetical protein
MTEENKGPEFDQSQTLKRYWELANLDPETTKGDITTQLKALNSLCQKLGLLPNRRPKKPLLPLQVYRSACTQKSQPGKDNHPGHRHFHRRTRVPDDGV